MILVIGTHAASTILADDNLWAFRALAQEMKGIGKSVVASASRPAGRCHGPGGGYVRYGMLIFKAIKYQYEPTHKWAHVSGSRPLMGTMPASS